MTRSIERKIKSLQDDLEQDYQFNLPGEIPLPTLYEVRRHVGGGGAAGAAAAAAVVDNRQININFQANNVAEAEQIANYIVEQFARPPRHGTTRGAY
jgi:hypothetical protein